MRTNTMQVQQLTNGMRLRGSTLALAALQTATPAAPAPAAPRVLAPVDPDSKEVYTLRCTPAHGGPTEAWQPVVLQDRVTHAGTVLVYLTDGEWRCEVPNAVLLRVLEGRRVLIERHNNARQRVATWVELAEVR